jgi:hypothetical protein
MKFEHLIAPIISNPGVFPATLGTYFPQTIELPVELQTYFAKTWLDSEYTKHEEIGGNLIWVAGGFGDDPVVAAQNERSRPRSRSIGDFRPGSTAQPVPGFNPISFARTPGFAPRRDKVWTVVKPENISIGTGGNNVNIPSRRDRTAVADFHTHPSTPGGTNPSRCGYQPPSLEDLVAIQHQEGHGKGIFVSFVVVHTSDLYAMVYIRGVSHFDTDTVFAKIKRSLDGQAKLIKFPNSAAEEKYLAIWMKDPGNPVLKRKLDEEAYLATNYGERFAGVIKDHLKWACDACYIGLYRGEIGGSLSRV